MYIVYMFIEISDTNNFRTFILRKIESIIIYIAKIPENTNNTAKNQTFFIVIIAL
jgi:hypothetical protein